MSETSERRAQKLVAVSFFLLASYVAVEAVRNLNSGDHAQTSWLGIGLTLGSLSFMPALGIAKKSIGAKLSSAATAGEGTQNLLCAYLAIGVLAGLLANTLYGLWWLDPAIGLVIAAVAVKEGREAWAGRVRLHGLPVPLTGSRDQPNRPAITTAAASDRVHPQADESDRSVRPPAPTCSNLLF